MWDIDQSAFHLCTCAAVGIILATPGAQATDLGTSPSGHYVQYKGETLLLAGDSGTQCVMQDLNLDYRRWIRDCHACGLHAVHIWSCVAPRQKQDGSVLEERYGYVYPGATPWRRCTDGAAAADQRPRWDLTEFDEGTDPTKHYWPRLRDLCAQTKARDMLLAITVFFGWPKHNRPERPDWLYHPFNVGNGGFLTTEEPITTVCQTIFSPGEEVLHREWSDDWPASKKTQWVWERLAAKLIQETAAYGNVFFVFMDEHSYPEGNCGDHFLRFFKERGAVWVDWNHRREEVDWVCSGTFSSEDKNADAVTHFAQDPPRPYLHLEGGPYQGDGARTAMWTFLIGGGHYFFHADAGQQTARTGIMGYDPHVPGGDRGMRPRQWLGHASRFFNEGLTHLEAMSPHNELVKSGAAYCLAALGTEYAVYSPSGARFELDLSAADGERLVCTFYDPRTGAYAAPFEQRATTAVVFKKPSEEDWALLARLRGPVGGRAPFGESARCP